MGPDASPEQSSIEEIDDSQLSEAQAEHNKRIAAMWLQREGLLLRMLTRRGCSRDEAMDIAQEALLKLLSAPPNTISFLEGYLWRICQHLMYDRGRTRQYRAGRRPLLDEGQEPHEPAPEHVVLARQQMEVVYRALSELSETCRRVFELRVLEDRPILEVAKLLGIDRKTVIRNAARAVTHCKLAVEAAEKGRDREAGAQ